MHLFIHVIFNEYSSYCIDSIEAVEINKILILFFCDRIKSLYCLFEKPNLHLWSSFREIKGNVKDNFTLCKASLPD